MQHKRGATLTTRLLLCLMHEPPGDAPATLRRSNIQRDNVAGPSAFHLFKMQDDKTRQHVTLFGYNHARIFRLGKPAHSAAGKAKGALKAKDVERVHSIKIGRLIAVQQQAARS